MSELEALKNITVNIDSETALKIANSYISYKYFDSICSYLVLIILFLVIAYIVNKITESDEL